MARKILKKPLPKKVLKSKPNRPKQSAYEAEGTQLDPNQLKINIAAQAVKEFEAGLKYKQKRMEIWLDIERMYNLEKEKTIQEGRYDYPLPVLSGYVDTLHSKIDDEPYLEYGPLTLADTDRAKKMTAAWRFYSNAEHADWAGEDRAGKKMCIMTGRAIFITYCESDPEFKHYFELIDTFDYVAQAMGGGRLKDHTCGFQDNIFRSKWQLKNSPHYDQAQVKKLIDGTENGTLDKNSLLYRNKINRLISVGLSPEGYTDHIGTGMYRLTQGFTTYQGKMYWIVMDMATGLWLRCDLIKEVFESGTHPFTSWASHYDKFNFWSKSTAEDVMPVARGMRDLYNEGMYSIKKTTSGQRAYDPDVFDEPELLEWRPDGLVPANVIPGKSIESGVYEFKTPDNARIVMQMFNFSDNLLGTKTGISASAQGTSERDKKVGVYYGDLQQVADRLGLTNKYYAAMWREAGDLFAWGIWEHFPNKLMIRITGESDWVELKKEDTSPEYAVIAKSTKAELEANEFKKKQKDDALREIMHDPRYASFVNPILAVQLRFSNAGWEEDDVQRLMDIQTVGDEKSVVKAAQAIQELQEGKMPKIYRSAGLAFLKKLQTFFEEHELEPEIQKKFITYFEVMVGIVGQNVNRMRTTGIPRNVLPPNIIPNSPMTPPLAGTPAGTASESQRVSNQIQPQ
ncbi:MAG: portal protein [Podoviridae sp. ctviO18]|nr:MAG: portal protein [Podoviridae sp. ctviO18]